MWFFGEGTSRAKEGKGSRTRGGDEDEGDSENRALAEARAACRLESPHQTSSRIMKLMLLRRQPAHGKSNNYGTRLNALQ